MDLTHTHLPPPDTDYPTVDCPNTIQNVDLF